MRGDGGFKAVFAGGGESPKSSARERQAEGGHSPVRVWPFPLPAGKRIPDGAVLAVHPRPTGAGQLSPRVVGTLGRDRFSASSAVYLLRERWLLILLQMAGGWLPSLLCFCVRICCSVWKIPPVCCSLSHYLVLLR